MSTIQYGGHDRVLDEATTVYIAGLQARIDEINAMYVTMGLDVHLHGGRLLASTLPISINH